MIGCESRPSTLHHDAISEKYVHVRPRWPILCHVLAMYLCSKQVLIVENGAGTALCFRYLRIAIHFDQYNQYNTYPVIGILASRHHSYREVFGTETANNLIYRGGRYHTLSTFAMVFSQVTVSR